MAFDELLLDACLRLADMPRSGTARPDLGVRGLRAFPVGAYMVLYRPLRSGIEVNRIIHQSRDLPREFNRLRKRRRKPAARKQRKRKAK